MKTITRIFGLLILLFISHNNIKCQVTAGSAKFAGSWLGTLDLGAMKMRLVFNINHFEPDSLSAKMDSPDQGAKDIPMGKVIVVGDSLKILAPFLAAKYIGLLTGDTLILGKWIQGGRSIDCNLAKQKSKFALNRPQEPKPPFPYSSTEVTFKNETSGYQLAGTVVIPEGDGPFPAVILISGSGAQDRNESILGHKPFLVIADWLARNGIASLRYDDRGVGKSQGVYSEATSADLATDALSAYFFLKETRRINADAIGMAGHSEGGLIAPIAAAREPGIAFIVSLAGPGVNGERIILTQSADIGRAMGIDEKEIKSGNELNKRLYGILKREKDNKKAEELILAEIKKSLVKSNAKAEDIEKSISQTKASFGASSYKWIRYFITTDPAVYWKRVKCPVLAINGDKDLQVSSIVNLPAIEKAVKSGGNMNVKTVSMQGLNHLFQSSKTGAPSEYGTIEETFSADALKIISDWILSLEVSR